MTDLGRVLVLAGGLTYERDVSLRSGRRVVDALRGVGVDATISDADAALLPLLAQTSPDAVFIALHGGSGEDGAVRGVLECAGVPYVGTDARACRLAFDKPTAKQLVTPPWVAIPHATFRELGATAVLDRIVARLGLPLMVKPAAGGSALGASAVVEATALPAAMVACFAYGDTALVERYVTGVEVAVAVVETSHPDPAVALPAVEIVVDGLYDYSARYTAGAAGFFTPARLSPPAAAEAARVALAAHTALGLRDISRTDAIVTDDGVVHFLEVNVSPGMTETSLLPMAAAEAGLDLGVLCRDLLAQAAGRVTR